MKVIDCVTFNGEFDLLDLRLNILSPYVDRFIVVEFDKTFSGKVKPFYGKDMDKFLEPWKGKVEWHYHTEKIYGKYDNLAWQSPNTLGAEHWKTEFMMKESIKDCLTSLDDENIIYIGDVDEIWRPFPVSDNQIFKLKLKVYTYWLNNKSSEEFWGTIAGRYGSIKGNCLNHIRSTYHIKTQTEWGWHFTSMGGYDKVKEKLTDSYTEETYASKQVLNNLEDNIKGNRDFLGRDFKYLTDDSELPIYLQENKEKYKHLFK